MAPAHRNRTPWIFLFCFFCFLFSGAHCLKCLQCSNSGDPECFDGKSPAKECPNKNHSYCITFSGYVKETGSHRLFRNCTQTNLSNECKEVILNVTDAYFDGREMKVCYHTCATDGCNTDVHDLATNLSGFSQLILISVLFICATFSSF